MPLLGILSFAAPVYLHGANEIRIVNAIAPDCVVVDGFTLISENVLFQFAKEPIVAIARQKGANSIYLSKVAYRKHQKRRKRTGKEPKSTLIFEPGYQLGNPAKQSTYNHQGVLLKCKIPTADQLQN